MPRLNRPKPVTKNTMKTTIAFSMLIVGISYALTAQQTPTDITKTFFETFKTEPLKAMDVIFDTNPYLKDYSNAVKNLKNQYLQTKDITGVYHSYEKITEKNIGDNVILYSYLVRFERIPLRFTFIYYRAKDVWRLNHLIYDHNLFTEMQESAKQNRI